MSSDKKITVKDITLIGMMIAVLEVSKMLLNIIPNVELVSFLIIMFTLFFGRKTLFALPVFILIEGLIFGFHLWWIMYLYTWPLLSLITHIFRKNDSVIFWSVVSSAFGFLYGLLCSIPYYFIGFSSGGLKTGLIAGITWWISGIPYDIIHGVANFLIMFALYHPIKAVMIQTKKLVD